MIRKLRFVFFISLFLNFFFSGNNPLLATAEEEVIKLILGETKAINVRTPSRVVIGNPSIADIADVSNSLITISAKAAGATTLVFWDLFGEQSVKIRVVAEDMHEIKWRVDNILKNLNLPNVSSQAADEENKVILLGNVPSPQDKERIAVALGQLKDKTVDLIEVKEDETVVEIDVQVLELNKDATNTLGFTWPGSVTIATDQTGGTSATSTVVTAPLKWATLFDITKWSRTNFEWKLDTLIQEGKARVLSRPRLACQSGKEAELMVGGEKPIFATYTSEISTGATVEYKEYGIKLKIKPIVKEEERIKLSLNVEVSEVGDVETLGTVARAYPFTKRTASTEVFINNGQTMAIGGLIKQKTEEDLRKMPWLADVPVLGLFFRKKTTKVGGGTGIRGDVELFITLTPRIIGAKETGETKKEIKPKIFIAPAIGKDLPEPVSGYVNIVQKRILDNLNYPRSAREAGFQGTVKLGLHLSYTGELLDVAVKASSGYKILDDDAVSIARSISSYPPFPSSMPHQELWVEVPIRYQLD